MLPILAACGVEYEVIRVEPAAEKILRASENEPAGENRTLVVSAERMDEVMVATITYKDDLTFDLYYPADFPVDTPGEAVPIPFVIFPLSFTVETFAEAGLDPWKEQVTAIQWGQVLAARGLGAVFYDTTSVTDDLEDLVELLLDSGADLGLDINQVGVIASSANGRIGMKLALDNRPEYVAAIRAAPFIHASLRPVAISRNDIPIFVVYTDGGGTEFDSLSKAFVQRGKRAGLEITVRDDAAIKGFEYDDPPAPGSREIITQVIEFMERHLLP